MLSSEINEDSIKSPLATSSPTSLPQRPKSEIRSRAKNKIKIVINNFQSLTNKSTDLANLTDSLEPDILLGTESHLDTNHISAEFFPGNYIPHRKDRNKYGGGVCSRERLLNYKRNTR